MFGTGLFAWHQYRQQHAEIMANKLSEIKSDLHASLESSAAGMATALQPIVADERMRSALLEGDRDRLLSDWQPVFDAMHKDNHITHFYFFDTHRVCLLRVHKPEKHGDLINRFTALEAERTGKKTASGIELGPLGTFTLRVVQPVFQDNRLLGYIELGKEIEDVLQDLHVRSGSHLALAIRKEHLDRETWENGMKFLGREAFWDQLPRSVIVYTCRYRLPDVFATMANHNPDGSHTHHKVTNVNFDGRVWSLSSMPMRDVSGKEVGDLLAMLDITTNKAEFTQLMLLGGAVYGIVLILLVAFVYVLLRRTDRNIALQRMELLASEERHRAMFQKNKSVQLLVDPADGIITDANPAACTFYGYSLEQMRQMNISDINTLSPDEIAKEMASARLEKRHRFLFKHRISDGQIRDVEVYSGPIPANGREWLYSIVHDVTDRARADEQLHESRDQYQSLVDNIPGITYRCKLDKDWTMLYMSTAIDSVSGYPASDFINNAVRTYASVIHSEDSEYVEQSVNKAMELNAVWEIEYRILHKDGSIHWAFEKGRGVFGEEGTLKYIDGFILDITDRKTNEEEREKLLKELQKALEDVNTLRGLIPICSSCKKIRDDEGSWNQMEIYISDHSKAKFSHGICPECSKRLYPEYQEDE